MEKRGPGLSTGGRGEPGISRWRLGGSHEPGKGVDVIVRIFTTDHVRIVVAACGVRDIVAQGCDLSRIEPVSYTHLIQVSATRKGKQAGILALPAEATDAKRVVCFSHRHERYLSLHAAWLAIGNILQGRVGNRFHEAKAQQVGGHAPSANSFSARHSFLGLFIRVIVDDSVGD